MDYLQAKGDPVNRNSFLEEYKSFVRKVASTHCRRLLEWGRDEELSVALIALDSAIDSYQPQKGAGFDTFASLVIKRRLIDYQRSQNRRGQRELCVDELPQGHNAMHTGEEFLRLERAAELEEFARIMGEYGVSFADLTKESPRHPKVRERMLRVVAIIAAQQELLHHILKKGRLPMEHLSQLTGESVKALATRRRYLLALLTVAARPGDYPFIASYLGIRGDEHE